MDALISFFTYQWQKKMMAILTALVIWFLVSHTIISTKTIPSVPIRIVNLPSDKAIQGMLPNGFLAKRTTLSLTGTRDVIEQLEPGDLEVILDVSNQPNEQVINISKKNLVSLNPNVNLLKHVTGVTHPELVIKMSELLTEKIPVYLRRPVGEAPEGYEFLDSWPLTLFQTVSGPYDQVLALKKQGLELTFNLEDLTHEDLDSLQPTPPYDDEVNFNVPESWKKIAIPSLSRIPETLNDPDAKYLQISFLKNQWIPFKKELPLHIFYPLKTSEQINPETYAIVPNDFVSFKNHIPILKIPLFVSNVSRLFLEAVESHTELQIVAAPKSERDKLEWAVGFIDVEHLENNYVALLFTNMKFLGHSPLKTQEREKYFRRRFRKYMQRFSLYSAPEQPLQVESTLQENKINIDIPRLPEQVQYLKNAS